ncbi:MAG: hypothetical protein M1830_009983 [Pleopsidium flavum]|nr:MAG: hypothetical protein M1830_009983 [Pleopsidium flavum]
MGDRSAFFYGTLMAPPVLHRVIHGSPHPEPWQASLLTIHPAVLHDHCRHRVRNCDYPAITAESGSTVRGTFVKGLTDGDIWRLDIFEGDEYARQEVRVRLLSEVGEESEKEEEEREMVEAETYVWVAGKGNLETGEWDFEGFRREKMGAWVGGGDVADEGITEVDEAVRAQKRDPTGGRGLHGKISNQLAGAKEREVLESAV